VRLRAAKSPQKGHLILWFALCLSGLTTYSAFAADDGTIVHNNFGGIGIIDMPSARMAPDGQLSGGASFFQNTQHYNFGFQVLPWLEASFRYSGLQHFNPLFSVYYDRSFALKVRVSEETSNTPAIAVGVNDLVGTGIYAGEYLVASKTFGQFDTTVGIGWGRMGSTALFRNPLASLVPSFENRRLGGDAGGTNFNAFFHGPSAGIFGGVIWHTPIKKLSLLAEYSSDTYSAEADRGNFRPRSQLNFGASYEITHNFQIGLDWLYGRSVVGNIVFQLNPVQPQYPAKLGPQPLQIAPRSTEEQQQAIQMLLHERRGTVPPLQRASFARANFVDALWRQNGINDVELNGNSLILAVSGNPGRHCVIAAQLAQSSDSTIKDILVRSTDGRRPVQCVTTAAQAPYYQTIRSAAPISAVGAPPPDAKSLKVIDGIGVDPGVAMQAIRADARQQQIGIEAISLTQSTAILYYSNLHYFSEADALDRLTRILMKDTPPNIEKFRLIAVINGIPQQEFDVLRGPEERKFEQIDHLDIFGDVSNTVILPPPMQNPALAAERGRYPRLSWSLFPQLRQELFDPDNPFAVQLAVGLEGSAQLWPGFSLNGEVETSLFDNFNNRRAAISTLPHVRSDFLNYFDQGKTGIGNLDAQYRFRLAPSVFAIAKAGYLESMFAGGGGEILWRPEGQRWAFGVDGYEVWQRGFDRLLDLQKYHVFTGHVSLYYASPWQNLNFILSAGQYLAGDRGLTFQMTRRFSTGVEIGAFFTKTNVSSQQFGEGSFDKGIIIRIPLGWALPIETQGQWGINLRPVQRDGGQRLDGDASLYDETQRTSFGEISLSQGQSTIR